MQLRQMISSQRPNHCQVMAHRGASSQAPGNTLLAFAAAVAAGADVIETDVHWTRDGVLVVAHDDTVDAVSDGTGRIDTMTFQALRQLDFGYRYTEDGGSTFPFRGLGVRIPAFQELLIRWPTLKINVDLKPKRANVPSFLQVVDEVRGLDRILLASFHHATLNEARARCPALATSASPREVAQFVAGLLLSRRPTPSARVPYAALQVPVRVAGRHLVTERFVERAHHMGTPVHVWTVDDKAEMHRLISAGVDGIVTNRPDLLFHCVSKNTPR